MEHKNGGIFAMTLGQRIQQIRTQHNLSQEEFAAKLGTTRQTVSRWELDQTYPEIAKIVLLIITKTTPHHNPIIAIL